MDTEDDSRTKEEIESERKQYTTRGTSGICNIGNTCYMNSALQCLVNTDVLVPYFRGTHMGGDTDYKFDLMQGLARQIVYEEISKAKKQKVSENECRDTSVTVVKRDDVKKRFKNSLTYQFKRLVSCMWGVNCCVRPNAFKEKLGDASKVFYGWSQNDSQECLSLILDTIHEETKTDVILEMKQLSPEVEEFRQVKNQLVKLTSEGFDYNTYKREHLRECAIVEALEYWHKYIEHNHSVIEDIFAGLFFGSIKCLECENFSFRYEPFKIINLHIPSDLPKGDEKGTLESCLKDYFGEGEKLEGDCQYSCECCKKKTDAIKYQKIWHSPYRLIIHFKRFIDTYSKNSQKIVFPIEGLNMSDYMSEYVDGEHVYDLYAISYHSGSLRGGHYTAYAKSPMNGEWYYYDDSNVLHISQKLTKEEFTNFFSERLMEEDVEQLKNFISHKKSQNVVEFGADETDQFLKSIECNNCDDIIDDYKVSLKKKLERELITSGAYWLMYKKREPFEMVKKNNTEDEDDNDDSLDESVL